MASLILSQRMLHMDAKELVHLRCSLDGNLVKILLNLVKPWLICCVGCWTILSRRSTSVGLRNRSRWPFRQSPTHSQPGPAYSTKCCLVLSCTILCSTAFCRLSNDSQRLITQRIDVDGAAYRLHGHKLAGIAFNREWNNVGETASAAAAHCSKFEMMVCFCSAICRHHSEFFRRHRRVIMGYVVH